MDTSSLEYFIPKLASLKRGVTKFGLAPHKAILLLSIFDLIDNHPSLELGIPIENELFTSFNRNWELLVKTGHNRNIFLPLHHLDDGLGWQLISKQGIPVKKKFSSYATLEKEIAIGVFNEPFSQLLMKEDIRLFFKHILLDSYFADTKENYWKNSNSIDTPNYYQEIEQMILEEPKQKYIITEKSIEKYIRNWKFTDYVMNIYQNTCCISKLKVEPNYAILEACHIQPHAKFGNDSLTNGIALCVNLHRAFDNGLISIGKDYEVIFNKRKRFFENASPYNISQFKNSKILLPESEKFYPSQDYLSWHRKEHNF